MALLLTRECQYAIIIAIYDGQQFTKQDDKDIYITSRLNLKLPRLVDDLIPPTTLISTSPTIMTENPRWRTTLLYYVSRQILRRLRRKQAQVTLELVTLPEKGSKETIGSMILQMDQAKMVMMHKGSMDIAQIQQFVVDKGDWLTVSENNRSKVKAGLFIVELPNNTNAIDKEVGTPLHIPVKSNYFNRSTSPVDVGLEIYSDVSEIFVNDSSDEEDYEEEEEQRYEDDALYPPSNENEQDEYEQDGYEEDNVCIRVGEGQDQWSFIFQILGANHLESITEKYPEGAEAYFRFAFADDEHEFAAQYHSDHWQPLQCIRSFQILGHLDDIKVWLEEQAAITVHLIVASEEGNSQIIGHSEVYLTGRDLGVLEQSTMVYDCDKVWHINSKKQFSNMDFRIGLERGWNEEEEEYTNRD